MAEIKSSAKNKLRALAYLKIRVKPWMRLLISIVVTATGIVLVCLAVQLIRILRPYTLYILKGLFAVSLAVAFAILVNIVHNKLFNDKKD